MKYILIVTLFLGQTAHAEETMEPIRLRMGGSLSAGVFVRGLTADADVEARAGAQINRRWGAYGAVGFNLGLPKPTGTYLGFVHLAVMGERTFVDRYFAAAGPLVAVGFWSAAPTPSTATAAAGVFPGLDFRFGIGLGSMSSTGRRHQFTAALDLKVMLATRAVSATTASDSSTTGPRLGTTVMIMIGYDMK